MNHKEALIAWNRAEENLKNRGYEIVEGKNMEILDRYTQFMFITLTGHYFVREKGRIILGRYVKDENTGEIKSFDDGDLAKALIYETYGGDKNAVNAYLTKSAFFNIKNTVYQDGKQNHWDEYVDTSVLETYDIDLEKFYIGNNKTEFSAISEKYRDEIIDECFVSQREYWKNKDAETKRFLDVFTDKVISGERLLDSEKEKGGADPKKSDLDAKVYIAESFKERLGKERYDRITETLEAEYNERRKYLERMQ